MAQVYQYLLKHHQRLNIKRLYSNDADIPPAYLSLLQQTGTQVYTNNFLLLEHIRQYAPNLTCHYSVPTADWFCETQPTLFIWTKTKALAQAVLELAANRCRQIWVLGANNAGGRSIGNSVESLCQQVIKQDSARKCSLWQLQLNPRADFSWHAHQQHFTWQNHTFSALSGVFSSSRLDPASALLLEHVELPASGVLFDVACGSGILGLAAKLKHPNLEVSLYDADALALKSTQLNAEQLRLKVQVSASNMLSAANTKADVILCNPPFHQGIKTDYRAYQSLLADSQHKLQPQGTLWVVANQHLPYEQLAQTMFKQVQIHAKSNGFKLLRLHN